MRVVRSVTTTFRDFIKTVEDVLGFIEIDTDSFVQIFPLPPPVEPLGAPAIHREPEGQDSAKVSVSPSSSVEQAKALKPSEEEKLVKYATETWGDLDIVPGRETTMPALEAKLGRAIPRDAYRAIMNKALPSGKRPGGRPKKLT
jgi:hypothetical protein